VAPNAGWVDQNRRLSTNDWLYLENGTGLPPIDLPLGTMLLRVEVGTRRKVSTVDDCIFYISLCVACAFVELCLLNYLGPTYLYTYSIIIVISVILLAQQYNSMHI